MNEEDMQALRDRIVADVDDWWGSYDWDSKFKVYLEGLDNEV